jgi:hypothetical protein
MADIRDGFIAALLLVFSHAAAFANSCSNVNVIGTHDQSGLQESDYGIYAAGTFRTQGESDESKQPMFNLSTVWCETKPDDAGKTAMECRVIRAYVIADSEKPNADNPNCSLDLEVSDYSMKELQKKVCQASSPSLPGVSTRS